MSSWQLEHASKREIEAKVFALRDELEEAGVVEAEVDERCAELRRRLLDGANASDGAHADGAPATSARGAFLAGPAIAQPAILRGLLSDSDIEEVLAAAATAARRYPRAAKFGEESEVCASEAAWPWSAAHDVLYLHRDGFCARSHGPLLARLIGAMGGGEGLNVRCVEVHRYGVGGSLLIPGHRDIGSEVSLSALLADDFGGGEFSTTSEAGARTVHGPLSKGDAVLFPSEAASKFGPFSGCDGFWCPPRCTSRNELRSETVHNVAEVTRGERRALVIELWRGGANSHDRSR